MLAAAILIAPGITVRPEPVVPASPASLTAATEAVASGSPARIAAENLPPSIAASIPLVAAGAVGNDPSLAVERVAALPDPASDDPWEAGVAALFAGAWPDPDGAVLADQLSRLDRSDVEWLAAIYPELVGNRPGVPYDIRIAANHIRVVAAAESSTRWPQPDRPWTEPPRRERVELTEIANLDQQLIYFDAFGNEGEGSWAELVGDLSTATEVGVLVPGGSAFLTSDNFTRYTGRASTFVDAADGLAMIIWAAAPFPSGWIQEASGAWAASAAGPLAAFTRDLRRQVGPDVGLTLVGHSYGGAMVGLAELYPMDVDRILHVASAGAGFGVDSPADYLEPCRPRFVVMAPGDPISYVQNIPRGTGLGHGVSTAELDGVVIVTTGHLPDDPDALDDVGRTLGSQGIVGKRIGGLHAHSEVFIPDSDAWDNMLAVLTFEEPTIEERQPPPQPDC
ncbi:Alpha/beta hydrolase [Stackebrandtia soli]